MCDRSYPRSLKTPIYPYDGRPVRPAKQPYYSYYTWPTAHEPEAAKNTCIPGTAPYCIEGGFLECDKDGFSYCYNGGPSTYIPCYYYLPNQ